MIPCKNCISFALCRSYYKSKSDILLDWMIRQKLEMKCELLYNYAAYETYEKTKIFYELMEN